MKFKAALGLLSLLALIAAPAFAGQKLVVEKNHTLRVALNGSAGSVIVGNPDIADVTVIDSHTVYVLGKGYGNSAVTITDRAGRSLFDGVIVVTSASQGGVTVYKGLTPSLMVCSNICVAEAPAITAAANPAAPAATMPSVVAATTGGSAMQVQ